VAQNLECLPGKPKDLSSEFKLQYHQKRKQKKVFEIQLALCMSGFWSYGFKQLQIENIDFFLIP
jgi:hypothetical protein